MQIGLCVFVGEWMGEGVRYEPIYLSDNKEKEKYISV